MKTTEANEQILAEMMVGREVLFEELDKKDIPKGEVLLVEEIKARDNRGLIALDGVSFNLKKGEILGIAHVPEDRLATGLSKEATVSENLIMGIQHEKPYAINGIHINNKKVKERTNRLIDEFDIRTPSGDLPAGKLSGGNMQRMVIAREFSFQTPILIIAQPTRGVDVGAIEFIHSQIIEKRNNGVAILLVSAELDEIFRLSDRIITFYEGKITGEFLNDEISNLPKGIGILLAIFGGGLVGGIYAFIPGLLKVKYKIDEVITAIMLNSVAVLFTSYLVNYPFATTKGKMGGTEIIAEGYHLSRMVKLSTLNTSIFFMGFIAIIIYYLMEKTSAGYDFKIVGQNSLFARYGGIDDKKQMIIAMVISGALCGIAGVFEVLGVHYRFLQNISPGYA
ncbi:ABC transporter permease subunit [Clostridium sp. Cult2]|uniref:ABC transporter permease subunit n=1 Tax=Clostridium sp. Cult2 TaxID=2079003 RepID=UPI001F414A50|nr:hypothetical protein [Clostridium sp. Cult2]